MRAVDRLCGVLVNHFCVCKGVVLVKIDITVPDMVRIQLGLLCSKTWNRHRLVTTFTVVSYVYVIFESVVAKTKNGKCIFCQPSLVAARTPQSLSLRILQDVSLLCPLTMWCETSSCAAMWTGNRQWSWIGW